MMCSHAIAAAAQCTVRQDKGQQPLSARRQQDVRVCTANPSCGKLVWLDIVSLRAKQVPQL